MDLQALRKEYENDGIELTATHADPLIEFQAWFEAANEHCPGRWFEPNAMSLATSTRTGEVSVRIVLLKEVTSTGIRFFTNYESEKGQQMANNPRAAVVFHWPYLGRQVRLSGDVIKTSREVSDEYFHSRPRGSQIGAAVSRQSSEVATRAELDWRAQEMEQQYAGQEIPLPEFWGGYELTVERAEFWQGRTDRLHDRIVYQQQKGAWNRVRLSP